MIRLAIPEDLKAIMDIINEIKVEMKKEKNPQWHEGYPLEPDFLEDINSKELYVLEENNIIVALVCIQNDITDQYESVPERTKEKSLVLHRLAVALKYQHQGYDQKLFQFAENLAIENNIFLLKADTETSNKKMNQLFKKLNFQQKGTLTWSDNDGKYNYYEKKLGSDKHDI